jgi:hypothetical protein
MIKTTQRKGTSLPFQFSRRSSKCTHELLWDILKAKWPKNYGLLIKAKYYVESKDIWEDCKPPPGGKLYLPFNPAEGIPDVLNSIGNMLCLTKEAASLKKFYFNSCNHDQLCKNGILFFQFVFEWYNFATRQVFSSGAPFIFTVCNHGKTEEHQKKVEQHAFKCFGIKPKQGTKRSATDELQSATKKIKTDEELFKSFFRPFDEDEADTTANSESYQKEKCADVGRVNDVQHVSLSG